VAGTGELMMGRTSWRRLVLIAVLIAGATAAVLHWLEGRGLILVPPPLLVSVVMVGIAVFVGKMGWNVRQYAHGKRPGLDPILAARTVVLATAAAYTGALLAGWYGGHGIAVIADLGIEARREVMVGAVVAVVGAVTLAVAGLVAERWCEVPPPDDDNLEPGAAA
jgi:hypothetical protein